MSWELGISTGIAYRHPIEDVLEPIHRSGVRVIEAATAREHMDLADPRRLEAIASGIHRLDMRVHSLHAPFGHDVDFTDADADFRRRSIELLTRAADALVILGGTLYVVHPGGEDHDWVWDRDNRLARSVEGLNNLWEVCQARSLTLVVETPLPHLLGGQIHDLAWLLDRLPLAGTGVCVDTSHTSLGRFLIQAIEVFQHRLVHVQASDNRGVTDDHAPPGDGIIDWGGLAAKLTEAGYSGVFMLEVAGNGDVSSHVERAVRAAFKNVPGLFCR